MTPGETNPRTTKTTTFVAIGDAFPGLKMQQKTLPNKNAITVI